MEWAGDTIEWEAMKRSKEKRQWAEEECFLLLENIVSALAFAQCCGVAHGDVTPANIYMSEGPAFKINNFRGENISVSSISLLGQPKFLSPALRKAYALKVVGQDTDMLHHDPFKSDVYSLGLTLLFILSPQASKSFNKPDRLKDFLHSLPLSPSFQDTISAMIETDEDARPDFITLQRDRVGKLMETVIITPANRLIKDGDWQGGRRWVSAMMRCNAKVAAGVEYNTPPNRVKIEPKKTVPAVTVASAPLHECFFCSQKYQIRGSDEWRLELFGSRLAAESKGFCSEACFKKAMGLSMRSEEEQGDNFEELGYDDEEFVDEDDFIDRGTGIVLSYKFSIGGQRKYYQETTFNTLHSDETFFYDCQVHACPPEKLKMYWGRVNTSLLTPCPDCHKSIEILSNQFGLLTTPRDMQRVWFAVISINSLIRKFGKRLIARFVGDYVLPVTIELEYELATGSCHFCRRRIKAGWRCFFHRHKPDLVCSQQCAQQRLSGHPATCPECKETVDEGCVSRVLSEVSEFDSLLKTFTQNSCFICFYGQSSLRLPCNHLFCSQCMSRLVRYPEKDVFPCLFCGVETRKSDIKRR